MDTYGYIYDGEELSCRPVYGEDGVSRYAVELWYDSEPLNPRVDYDNLWAWAWADSPEQYYVPAEHKSHNGPYYFDYVMCDGIRHRFGYAEYDGIRSAIHHAREAEPAIVLPIVGHVNQYGAEMSIGTWADVAKERAGYCLVVASVPWSAVEKKWPGLDRQDQYAKARERLEHELADMRRYLNDTCYGYTVIDLLGDDDGISCGGFYNEDELRSDAEAECADYETSWEEKYNG